MAQTTYLAPTVDSIIEMFMDSATGEATPDNRLVTLENAAGNTILVGYGEKVLAEYNESEQQVDVYFGHVDGADKTVKKWLNKVVSEADKRRSVTISDDSPWFRPPNAAAAQYIGSYISFRNKSAVERRAEKEVIESLKWLDKFL